MKLDYLLFDHADEETGACSFDAMASVMPDRVPAVIREVEAVLGWAHRGFGAPSADTDAGEWGFELQAVGEQDAQLEIGYDFQLARASLQQSPGRVTIALTVTGSAAFAAAFREAFPDEA